MRSIPVVTTRTGSPALTARVLKSSGCLAFLLLFLLAAVSTASAATAVGTLTVTPATPATYGTALTIKAPLTTALAGTAAFYYGTTSGTQATAISECATVTVAAAATSVSCTTSTTVLPVLATYYFKVIVTTTAGGATASGATTTAFVVKQATPTVSWTAPAAITYPTALSSTQLNASTGSVGSTCVYTPAATTVLAAGTQTLSVTCTPTDGTDYATPAAATVSLTVNKGTPTYSWSAPSSISYPTALSSTQLDATLTGLGGTVASTCTYSPVSGTVLQASATPQTLTAICTPTDLVNYNTPVAASATTTLTVNKGTSVVTWANPADISYGTLLSATQLDATLNVPGTCTYASNPVGTQLSAGLGQTLTANCTPTDAVNYTTPAAKTATLNVNKTPLTVTASSTTVSLGAVAPKITPIYTGFLNSDNAYTPEVAANTANLTCSVESYSTVGTGAPWTNECTGGAVSTANYTYSYANGLTSLGTNTTTSLKITLAGGITPITTHPAGTSVTLTATVTGTGATGTVNFTYVDPNTLRTVSIPLCGSVTLNSAYAFCTTSALPVSSNLQLVATFSDPSKTFATSSNPTPVAYAVTQTTTTISSLTALAASGSSPSTTAVYGTSVTLTANVTGTGVTGTVSFTYGESPIVPIAGCSGANAIPVVSGTAVCVTTALPVATHEYLNAYFSNSTAAFSTSSLASPTDFAVTPAPTSTTLAVTAVSAGTSNSLTSVVYGSSVTLTATVTTGATGTVAFTYGSSPAIPITGCTAQPLIVSTTTTAQCVTTALPVASPETLNAVLNSASSNYTSSSPSASPVFVVVANAPTITLTLPTPATSTFGANVALLAGGLPVGAGAVGSGDTLNFFYGTSATTATNAVTCTNVVTISAQGTATCNTIMLPVATSFVVASYTPGTAMAANIGAGPFSNANAKVPVVPSIIVSKGSPVVGLSASPSGTTYVGASVLLTATITPSSAMDTGAVAFTWGATSTTATTGVTGCSAQSVVTSNGTTTATCTTTDITAKSIASPGNYLKAVYTPTTATNFNTIAAATANLIVVGSTATTTVVTVPAGTNYYGANPQLTATVSCASATCTAAAGSVTFYNNGVSIGTGTVATGVATLTPTTPLPVGSNLITATFNSTDSSLSGYANSTSLVVPVTVVATPTTSVVYANVTGATLTAGVPPIGTTVTATKDSTSLTDNSFTLYATVVPTAASGSTAVINGGNVSFYDVSAAGSVLLGTGKVTASGNPGIASFKVNCAVASVSCSGPLSLGTRYFTAYYGGVYGGTGVAQLAGSMSDSVPVVVSGTPTLTITASSPSVVIGAAAPVINPIYTISGGGPIGADWATCSASTTVDSNGVSVYSCTSVPSFLAAGNRAPVCTTNYSSTTSTVSGTAPTTTCSGAKNGNYTINNVGGTVTVTGKAPTWKTFNAVEVTYGNPVTLGATVNSDDSGAITYAWSKSNGCTLQPDGITYLDVNSAACTLTSLTGTAGNHTFSSTSWPGTYYVTAYVAADPTDNYAAASTQRTIIVIPTTPVVNWSVPTAIPYGTALKPNSAFGTCYAKVGTKTITGTCSWTTQTEVPGTTDPTTNYAAVGSLASAIFIPSSTYGPTGACAALASENINTSTITCGYAPVVATIPVNVTPVSPTLSGLTATNIPTGTFVYQNGANASILSNGVATGPANVGSPTLSGGTFAWTCSLPGQTACAAINGTTAVSVTYTPSSTNKNYTTATGTATVHVFTPTAITVTWPTSASALTYGQPLSSSVLSGGSAETTVGSNPVTGKFSWSNPTLEGTTPALTILAPGTYTTNQCVTFTPTSNTYPTTYSDGGNGTSCGANLLNNMTVVVNPATPTINWSLVQPEWIPAGDTLNQSVTFAAPAVTMNGLTVAGSFAWDATDDPLTTPLPIGTASYLVDFTPTTGADYNTVSGMVNITPNACGYQDSTTNINSVAEYVTTNLGVGATQISSATFPADLEGATNQSVLCVTNKPTSATAEAATVSGETITQGSTTTSGNSTLNPDAVNYGTNAAVLAFGPSAIGAGLGSSTITVTSSDGTSGGTASSITSTNDDSSGVFASNGGIAVVKYSTVTTNGAFSPALAGSYDGSLAITKATATTNGNNSPVIGTGIGSAQVTVAGGTYTANGASAVINAAGTCNIETPCTVSDLTSRATPWSTVAVTDATAVNIVANNGPAVVVEGGNKVTITSTGTTNVTGNLGNNQGVFLYQSGTYNPTTDATPATTLNPTIFTMSKGTLTYNCDAALVGSCSNGTPADDQNQYATLFSVTNTTATINLTDVTLNNNTNTAGDGILLTAAQLSTGPATVAFNLNGETVTGDVLVDANSTVNMTLAAGTVHTAPVWTGTFVDTTLTSGPGNTQGAVNLIIDSASTWIITTPTVTLKSLKETDNDILYTNVLCAKANPGCQVTITGTPTINAGPGSFSPTTSSN
jgi:hypothetical protein